MTTYYIDPVNGSDSNNGLGPDASHASNKPWATLAKALNSGTSVASGDTVYCAPGTYREILLTSAISASAETKILADPWNAQGFKTSGGVRVSAAPCIWTGYTTNDKTAPGNGDLLTVDSDHLTFENWVFISGQRSSTTVGTFTCTATATDLTVRNCAWLSGYNGGGGHIVQSLTANAAANLTVDRCIFGTINGSNYAINIQAPLSGSADYDVGVVIKNCLFLTAQRAINLASTGAGAFKPGGLIARNCTFLLGNGTAVLTFGGTSTSIPVLVKNCFIMANIALQSANAVNGEIVEDYNLICATTPRSSVDTGTHSISNGSYSPMFHFGQEWIYGAIMRPLGEPMSGSPLLGFGNDGNQSSYDVWNRPKPAGGGTVAPSVGALERGNTAVRETSVTQAGGNALVLTGPGYQDFYCPVDASSSTLSVYMRYDGTYSGGTLPQLALLANNEIGVAAQTATCSTAALNAWELNTLSAFTPTSKGVVTLRFISNDTNGAGKAYADTFGVS